MKKIYLLIIMFFLTGCQDKVVNKISNYIDIHCHFENEKDSCLIDLSDIIDIEWDKLYSFGEWSMPDDISRELGIDYVGNYVEDNTVRLIFVKKDEIVYEETYKVEGKKFDFAETCFGRDTCYFDSPEFYVKKKRSVDLGSNCCYFLYPAKRY